METLTELVLMPYQIWLDSQQFVLKSSLPIILLLVQIVVRFTMTIHLAVKVGSDSFATALPLPPSFFNVYVVVFLYPHKQSLGYTGITLSVHPSVPLCVTKYCPWHNFKSIKASNFKLHT